MVSDDRLRQWSQTERYLLASKASLPVAAASTCADDLTQFDEFIEHNELGLAADWLGSIVREVGSIDAMKFLALAEASMGRAEEQRKLDVLLSRLTGKSHETVLSSAV